MTYLNFDFLLCNQNLKEFIDRILSLLMSTLLSYESFQIGKCQNKLSTTHLNAFNHFLANAVSEDQFGTLKILFSKMTFQSVALTLPI